MDHNPFKLEIEHLLLDERTPEKQQDIPEGVPTPFKKALFWPEIASVTSKRKIKEKLPSVAIFLQ